MALQCAKRNTAIKVKAITTCFGNCNVNQVLKNVAKIRKANGFDEVSGPALALGCSKPVKHVENTDPIDATYFHGSDGLGDANIRDEVMAESFTHSTDLIIQLANEVGRINSISPHSVELSLIILGPLTNLAVALQKDSSICVNISHVFVMVFVKFMHSTMSNHTCILCRVAVGMEMVIFSVLQSLTSQLTRKQPNSYSMHMRCIHPNYISLVGNYPYYIELYIISWELSILYRIIYH